MLGVVVNNLLFALEEFDVDYCFLLGAGIPEVNEMPSEMPITVFNILEVVGVSVSIQICVSVGGEVQDSTFWSANPTAESSVPQSGGILIDSFWVDSQSEHEVPSVFGLGLGPFEPT